MAKRTTKPLKGPTPVDAIKHKNTRINIPTEELRDFVAEDEKAPKAIAGNRFRLAQSWRMWSKRASG